MTFNSLWTPNQLSALAWYDASDLSTITFNGSNISQWNDKSGNDLHATQTNVTEQPTTGTLNNLNVVSFLFDFLNIPSIVVKSAVFVIDKANGRINDTQQTVVFGGTTRSFLDNTFIRTNSTDYSISIDGNYNNPGFASVNGSSLVSGRDIDFGLSVAEKNQPLIFTTEYSNTVNSAFLAATFVTTSAFRSSNINIAEILFFDYVLDQATRELLVGYLAHKWGQTAKLPSNHPYKNNVPTTTVSTTDLLYYQLNGALNFILKYTRDTFPLYLSAQYLAPNAFHNVPGRLGYFPANMATSEAESILALSFFKAFEATAKINWKNLALNITDAYAGHFFFDNIYTVINQGYNTPLVRNHWLVIAYGSVATEGDQLSSDPFNFGTFQSATFTNGVAQLPSDLSKFYKAYQGTLHYKNLFAPLREGTEYPYEYFVRQGFKVFADGSQEVTVEPNGLVKLVSNYSGSLDCVYVRLNGATLTSGNAPLTGLNMAEPYPLFFKCKQTYLEYTSCATDTVWWAYEMFDYAFKHSNLAKYSNAREITKWNTQKFIIDRKISSYFLKKEVSDNPLRYPGSYVLQYAVDVNGVSQPLPGFTIARETVAPKANYIKLVINANSDTDVFSGVELQNFVTQVQGDPLVSYTLEVSSTVSQVLELKLSLSPDALNFSQEYKAYWLIPGDSLIKTKTFNSKSFLKFPAGNVWNLASAEIPLFAYNSATVSFSQETVFNFDTTVAVLTMPNLISGGGLINANYTNKIPNIVYSISGRAVIRFKDSEDNYYYSDIVDTGGAWLTFVGSWEQFGVLDKQLTEIVFQNVAQNAENPETIVKIFYVGDAPESLPNSGTIYKASITDRNRLAHTLWIGDFKPNNNPLDNKKYKPGVIDFVLNTLNGAESGFFGEQYYCGYQSAYILNKWGLKDAAKNVIQFWSDAQESYRSQSLDKISGLLHQNYLPYSPENIPYLENLTVSKPVVNFPIPFINQQSTLVPTDSYQFDTFSWKGLDPNTTWANYNNRAMEDLSRYFYSNKKDSLARKILVNYIKFIYSYYQLNPTLTITDIPPNVSPQSNYFEPHAAAIEGITALFANLAGIELEKTYWLINNRFEYISNQYQESGNMMGSWSKNQPAFQSSGQTYSEYFSFWHGKIIEFYSELLIDAPLVRDINLDIISIFPNIKNNCNSFADFITNIVEADYPKIDQVFATGTKQSILLSSNPIGKKISLKFNRLTQEQVNSFITFYQTVNNEKNPYFTFDTSLIDYSDFDGIWIFDDVPQMTTNNASQHKANFDLEFTIKQVTN